MFEEFTRELVEWIQVMPPVGIYLVFFLIAYLENIIPPIPGDILVAFGGYLAAESVILIAPVYLLTTGASVIGFMSLYMLGQHWGNQIKYRDSDFWMVRFIPLRFIEKARRWMGRWGQGVIVANRFLAGTRSVISLVAGMSHTTVSYTIISATISSLLWNGILLGFGWFVHNNWQIIGHYLTVYGRTILAVIALFLLVRLGIYYYRKKRAISD